MNSASTRKACRSHSADRIARTLTLLSVALAGLGGAVGAAAQVSQAMAPVVITGSRTEVPLPEAPGAVSLVTREEIDRRNVQTLDQAVEFVPGVYARRGKGLMDTLGGIRLRGVPDDSRTLILLDGLPLNDGYTGGVRIGGLSPTDVDRVEVVRGPSSALYGGAAMGGVVQFITRMPTAPVASLTLGFGGPLSSDTGYEDLRTMAIRLGTRFDGGFSVLASYSAKRTDGYRSDLVTSAANLPPTVTGAVPTVTSTGSATRLMGERGMNRWDDSDLGAAVRYDFNADHALTLRLRQSQYEYAYGDPLTYLRSAAGAPVFSFAPPPAGTGTLRQSAFVSGGGENRRNVGQLAYEGRIGGEVRVSFGIIDTRVNRFSTVDAVAGRLDGGPGRLSSTPSKTEALDAQWTGELTSRQDLTLGVAWRRDRANVEEQALSDWRLLDSAVGPLLYEASGRTQTEALFAQHAWRVTDTVTTWLGLRWDRWDSSDGYVNDVNPATGASRPGFPKRYADRGDGQLSPKLAVVWKAGEATTLRASAGTAFRAPNVYDLYRTWVSSSGTIFLANPELTPETLKSVDAGIVQQVWSGGELTLNIFHNQLEDLIYRRTVSDPAERAALCGGLGVTVTATNCRQFVNAGEARSRGAEIELKQRLNAWSAFATATYVDSEVTANPNAPASVGKRLTNVPEWVAGAGIAYDGGPLFASLHLRYVSKTYSTDTNSDTVNGVYGTYDPYTVWQFKGGWRFSRHLTATLSVDNLLDRQYYQFYRAPGRTWLIELTGRL
jgi:iron complex outermembrane receptor protein